MHARVGLLVAALAFRPRDLIAALAGWAAVPYRVGDELGRARAGGEPLTAKRPAHVP